MTTLKRFSAFLIIIAMLVSACVLPAYADGELPLGDITTEPMEPIERPKQPLKEAYTEEELKAILSGNHNFDIPEGGLVFNSTNFPLLKEDGTIDLMGITVTESDYYIVLRENGKVMKSNGTNLTVSDFAQENIYRWQFMRTGDGIYAIKSCADTTKALRAVNFTAFDGDVARETYIPRDTTFHWSVIVTSDGNAIVSAAEGTYANGLSMYCSVSDIIISNGFYINISLIDANTFVPCTALNLEEYYSVAIGTQ